MPVSFEQLLEQKFGTMPSMQSRQEKEDEEERNALLAIVEENEREPISEPPPPPPTFSQRVGEGIATGGKYLKERTEETLRVSGESALETGQMRDKFVEVGTAVGETALQLGTGFIGGLVGLTNFMEGTVRRAGQEIPTRKYIEDMVAGTGPPSDPNYWKKLTEQTHKLASDFTYAPRTPEGKALSETINYPLQALHYVSQGASQAPLARMLFTEDQRHAVAYAHELVTMGILGEIGMGIIGRNRTKRFQQEFSTAAREVEIPTAPEIKGLLPKNAESLLATAEEIITVAESRPEILNKLELVQGINPRLMPSLRERGRQIIERLNENPENLDYQTQAVSFFESTRRVQDDITQDLRKQIGDYVAIGDIRNVPHADRVERLKNLQQNREMLSPVDRWMVDKELAEIADIDATVSNVVGMIRSSGEDLSIGRIRREFGIGHEKASQLLNQAKEYIATGERPPSETPPAARRVEDSVAPRETTTQEGVSPVAMQPELVTDTPALRLTRKQRDYAKQQQEPVASAEREAFSTGLDELVRKVDKTTDDKIEIAQETSKIFTDKETTLKKLQDSIETGRDISAEIVKDIPGAIDGDFAVMKYKKALEIGRKGINDSSSRKISEILGDIVELFAFDIDSSAVGSNMANISLSHRQKMAAQRLLGDAKKSGRDLNELINETISDPDLRMTYRTYLGSISDAVAPPLSIPKNMRLDGLATSEDPPIQRRVVNGKDKVPVYLSEVSAVQEAPIKSSVGPSFLETPINAMRRFGPEIKAMTTDVYHKIKTATDRELKIMREDLTELKTMAGFSSRRKIADYAFGEGKALSPKEQEVVSTLEVGLGATLDRINVQRQAIGLDEIPSTTDPITFARTITALKEQGISTNLVTAPLDEIMLKLSDNKVNYPKTLTQRALRLRSERDVFQMYDAFTTSAIEQIRLAPLTAKMRELYGPDLPLVKDMTPDMFGVPTGESKWSMKEQNPELHRVLSQWTETLEGKSNFPIEKFLGVDWDRALTQMNENTTFALLAYSMKSVAAQPWALVNTMHRTGPVHTLNAIRIVLDALRLKAQGKPNAIDISLGESNVLSGRASISVFADWTESMSKGSVADALQAFREGRIKEFTRDIARLGMVPMQAFDMASAMVTYNAGKLKGMKQGMSGPDLVRFADDVVIDTQSSGWRGDLAPIQRNALGKSITQFQTFTIGDYNNIVHNVLKVGKGASPKEVAWSVAGFIGTVAAANTLVDVINMVSPIRIESPLPRPIKAARESIGRGDDPLEVAMNTFFETIAPYTPVLGGSRYGKGVGGPAAGILLYDIPRSLGGRSDAPSIYESASKAAGVPGSGFMWRMSKENDQRNVLDRVMNYRGDEEEGGASTSRGVRRRLRGVR